MEPGAAVIRVHSPAQGSLSSLPCVWTVPSSELGMSSRSSAGSCVRSWPAGKPWLITRGLVRVFGPAVKGKEGLGICLMVH